MKISTVRQSRLQVRLHFLQSDLQLCPHGPKSKSTLIKAGKNHKDVDNYGEQQTTKYQNMPSESINAFPRTSG